MKSFKDLIVWQKSHLLVISTYKVIANFPRSEEFALSSQIRRAAISIPSNIVEGFKRNGKKDSLHFYNISDASLAELHYQLILAHDLQYINKKEFDILETLIFEVGRLLNGWIKSQVK